MLACSCLNLVEYHQFERVKYEIESGKAEFFLRSIDFNNFFLISLGFSSGFQISSLFSRLVYTYDASTRASTRARNAFLALVLVFESYVKTSL